MEILVVKYMMEISVLILGILQAFLAFSQIH